MFFQRQHASGHQTHEKMLNMTHHQKMQLTVTMGYHFTPIGLAVNKKHKKILSVGDNVERREPLYSVVGNSNWYSHHGEQYGSFSKNKNRTMI